MTQKLEHKKRSILESLNGHLQMSAIRLKNIEIETNILPEKKPLITKIQIKPSNKMAITRLDPMKTHNVIPLSKNPIIKPNNKPNKSTFKALKPYDPLYKWNRGGRLKELRIRCQARKFFYIWRNKSIGQVTELLATQHYLRRLKRTTWQIWYQQYWRLRIEPRLFGRAILFHKSVSIRLVFTTWIKWTRLRLERSRNMEVARKFHRDNIARLAITNWVAWIFVKKCKFKLRILAEKQSVKIHLKFAFDIWKIAFQLKTEMNAKMAISVSHYNQGLLQKVIHQWLCVRPIVRQSKLNRMKSNNHFDSLILKLAFQQWREYHHKTKIKQKEKERWDSHYNWNLAHRYLMKWKQHHAHLLVEYAMADRCQEMRRRFQLRKYFIQWQKYYGEEKVLRVQQKLADQMNEILIKRRVWCHFKSFILQRREKNSIKENAQSFANKLILRRYTDKWISRLEEKENLNTKTEMGAARSHYRRVMHMKYFSKWSQFTSSAAVRNQNLSNAIKMFESRLLMNAIDSWHSFVIISKAKSRLINLKEHFVRKYVLCKYWTKWRQEKKARENLEIQVNQYVEIQKIQKRNKIFHKWFMLTKVKLNENIQVNRVQNHANRKLLSKCFTALLQNVQLEHQRKINIDLASIHWQQKLQNKVFIVWRMICLRKKHQTKLLLWRFHKTEYRIKRIVFNCWIEYTNQMKQIREQVQIMFERQRNGMVIQTFHAWRTYKHERQYRKRQTSYRLDEGQRKLDVKLKRSIFLKWKAQTHVRLLAIQKSKIADDLYRANCLRKYLDAWKQYYSIQQLRGWQAQKSSLFWQKSELIRIWLIWRQALADRQREHYYTRFALIHWANRLEAKIFTHWFRYTNERKEKAKKENEAFSQHKTRLKKYTMRQWVTSGDFLIQWRNQQANKHLSQSDWTNSQFVQDSVIRAIEKWKRFTATRCNRSNSTNRKTVETFPLELKQSSRKLFQKQIVSQQPKIRSQPKIPDFILESRQIDWRSSTAGNIDARNQKNQSENRVYNSNLPDEILLPPKSFERNSDWLITPVAIPATNETNQQLYEELRLIKEKLQHFKESKSILKNLEGELLEYDRAMTEWSPNCDSSFYADFNPTDYRARLDQSIEHLKIDISQQKRICIDLSKRFQEIMKVVSR